MTQEKSARQGSGERGAEETAAERAREKASWPGCGCSPDQVGELGGPGTMASCESMMARFASGPPASAGCCGPSEASGQPPIVEPVETLTPGSVPESEVGQPS